MGQAVSDIRLPRHRYWVRAPRPVSSSDDQRRRLFTYAPPSAPWSGTAPPRPRPGSAQPHPSRRAAPRPPPPDLRPDTGWSRSGDRSAPSSTADNRHNARHAHDGDPAAAADAEAISDSSTDCAPSQATTTPRRAHRTETAVRGATGTGITDTSARFPPTAGRAVPT